MKTSRRAVERAAADRAAEPAERLRAEDGVAEAPAILARAGRRWPELGRDGSPSAA